MGLRNLVFRWRRATAERAVMGLGEKANRRWALGAALVLICSLFGGCGPRPDKADGVQLIPSTTEIQPATTFEVRFDERMVPAAQVGDTNAVAPLEITPKLHGQFTWTSSRSGTFTPEEPLELGTVYRFGLRPDLLNTEGQPSKATLQRTVQTPSFGIAAKDLPQRSVDAPALPSIRFWFNADIRPDGIEALCGFVNSQGRRVPARCRQGTAADGINYWGDRPTSWRKQFEEHRRRADEPVNSPAELGEAALATPIGNMIVIEPQQPLPPGPGWKLVIARGYHSADGRHRGSSDFEAPIGDVREFKIETARFSHVLHRAPSLELRFSKDIPESLTNAYAEWVVVDPRPGDLIATVQGSTLSLAGPWERDTRYTIAVRRGFPSAEGFALPAGTNYEMNVPPVPPRIYFPAFSSEQYAGGNRLFTIQSVNVSEFTLRAKLLDAGNIIHGLRGYQSYLTGPRQRREGAGQPEDAGERYRRVDYSVVAGITIFHEKLAIPAMPDQGYESRVSWDRLLGGRKYGVVFLEAEKPADGFRPKTRLGAQSLVQVTDLGVVWKSGSDNVNAYVFSMASGQPIPEARVQLVSDENEPLREGTTDAAGAAAMASHTNATWLLVGKGEDLHALRLDQHNLHRWSFESIRNDFWTGISEEGQHRVAVFMDRDVYRPGEEAHLKIVARDLTAQGLSIPLGTTGLVQCFDAKNKLLLETNITLGDLGSFDLTLPLPAGPRGEYRLQYQSAGVTKHHSFSVADYQPAAFSVHALARPVYGPQEPIEVAVGGRYQFGKALERANLRWYLHAADTDFTPPGFKGFHFGKNLPGDLFPPSSFFGKGEARLEGHSNVLIQAEFPFNATAPRPRQATFQAEITDLNQQTIGRSVSFLRHSSDFYLGLKQPDAVLEAGKPLNIEVVSVGRDGEPWTMPVRAKVALHRLDWQSVLVQGAGNSVHYRNTAVLTNLWEKEVAIEPPAREKIAGEMISRGTVLDGATPSGAGEYMLEVSGQDAAGRPVASSVRFHVAASDRTAWNYRNEFEVKLVPNKPAYHPGESAEILIQTPFGGDAWVTVERERIRRQFAARLEGNAPTVRIPILPGDSPNVFVSVTVVRGAEQSPHQARTPEYRAGYCLLNIEDPATQLQVEATSSRTNYLPGAEILVTGSVRDAAGKPVANAEVTLYAVDEGVLSLTDYAVPDLHSVFLARRGLGVESGISLPFLVPEDASQLEFNNKGYLGGGGGKERVRQRFVACALWQGAIRTGNDGAVRANFAAPDGITRYRLIAVAHTASSQFGKAASSFSVSKPLMIEPMLPQFANVSDIIQARALIFNESGKAGRVAVSLALDDKATSDTGTNLATTLEVSAGGSAFASFPVTFTNLGQAKWTWRVAFAEDPGGYSDAVHSALPVVSPLPLLRECAFVRLDAPATNLLSGFNPQLREGAGAVRIRLSHTRLILLGEPMRHLLTYPYGCAEQTASSTLPWVILRQAPELLPLVEKNRAEANSALEAGVDRLLKMQTGLGGLAYWPGGSEPALWASTYGAVVLGLAREAGATIPDHAWNGLLSYLSVELRMDGVSLDDQCLALYALALGQKPEPAYHSQLFEKRARLSPSSRAALALAISVSGGSERMITELLQQDARTSRTNAQPYESDGRTDAMWLLALMRSPSGGAETLKVFDRLMGTQQGGHWGTTQGNAWALLALSRYLRVTDSQAVPGKVALTWGETRQPVEFTADQLLASRTLEFGPQMANAPLLLQKEGDVPLFAQVTLESRVPGSTKLAQNHGFGLERHYAKLTDENRPSADKGLQVGDRVLVTLKISVPEQARYVAVDDPLPSVLEAINPNFKTQQNAARPGMSDWNAESGWETLPADFRELRQDRVLVFANWVSRGNYLVQYVARVRAVGTVTAPAARIEEMYQPDRFGLSASETLRAE